MEEFVPAPRVPIGRNETPDTIAGWKALAERLLTRRTCVFQRNVEISSRYAWINRILPSCFKWAAMAAIASHRVRLTLYPLRIDPDRARRIDIPHSHPGRRNLLPTEDVNLIKATNNGVFDDIFWVHLAYVTAEDGIERLRDLLRADRHYAPYYRMPHAAHAYMAEYHPLRRPLAVDRGQRSAPIPKLDADPHLIDAILRSILDEARNDASAPCESPC